MSDQVRISFDDDGILVIDTQGLDDHLRRKLFRRGNIVRNGYIVRVQTLGPQPWPSSLPVDADCMCKEIIVYDGSLRMNFQCQIVCGLPPGEGGEGDPTV